MALGDPIDYTTYYARIATALETIATNSTAIKNSLATVTTNSTTVANNSTTVATNSTTLATNSTTIATNSTTVANNTTTLTNLASGPGIHISGPYDWLGYAAIYRLFVEQGDLLDNTNTASPDEQEAALALIQEYVDKIKSLPSAFDA